MDPRITIVVPVYKVEKYLEKCVTSLINQTFPDIEIILVDDGSPDSCPEICDYFAENDSRIKAIHKPNGGLSDARNAGIREASGEYILFVDSDDYIDLDACEKFICAAADSTPDVVVANARRIEGEKESIMLHQFNTHGGIVTGEQYIKAELKTNTMYMAAWLNLYNRKFLLDNNLEFKCGLLHEDEQFTPRVILKAKKVLGTDIVFYNYLIREDSITKKNDLTWNAVHIIQTCYELAGIYDKLEDDELKALLNDLLVSKYLYAFQIGGLHRKEYDSFIDKNFVWKHASSKRNRSKALLFIINKKLYFYLNKTSKGM